MIIEMRTYTLRPGSIAEVEKRFGAALPAREKHSKLAAFWHSEVGPLNQIIHVWAYDSFEKRAAARGGSEGRRLAPRDPGVRRDPGERDFPARAVLAAAGAEAGRTNLRNAPIYAGSGCHPGDDRA